MTDSMPKRLFFIMLTAAMLAAVSCTVPVDIIEDDGDPCQDDDCDCTSSVGGSDGAGGFGSSGISSSATTGVGGAGGFGSSGVSSSATSGAGGFSSSSVGGGI